MDQTKKYIIGTLIVLASLMSAAELYANFNDGFISEKTYGLWSVFFILLTVIWVHKDSRESDHHYPFEYGHFVYLAWPVLIPYHLISTRGFKGLAYLFGLIGLYWLPLVVGGVFYVYL